MKLTVVLERLAIVLASLALSVGLIAALSGFFAGRDQPGVSASTTTVGQQFRDQGDAHLRPGQHHRRYDSDPPTSGPHALATIDHDQTHLSNDQLLTALEVGNVVIMYGGDKPPPGLEKLVRSVGATFTPALAAAGQAVILAPRPGTFGVLGVAWAHMVRVRTARDPLLREFIDYWLGRGASGR